MAAVCTPEADVALLERLTERFGTTGPGLVIGCYVDGALVAHASRGLACLEHDVPLGPHTRFDIASMSKQMTAACALLLARDGLVDLDADLRELLPELRIAGVTLRRCLHHTAGLRDYMTVNELHGGTLADMRGEQEFLAWLGSSMSTEFLPGTDIAYSNSGYVAAAAALARAASQPFSSLLHDRVLAPLGMHETTVHDRVGRVVPALAFSYERDVDQCLVRVEMPEEQVGDGAVITTLTDLAAWHGFLVDGRALGADVRAELLAPALLVGGRATTYGAGVMLTEVAGRIAVEHSGHMYAYSSHLIAVPEVATGVAVLSNLGGTDATSIAHQVLRGMLPAHAPRGVTPTLTVLEPATWWATESNQLLELRQRNAGSVLLMPHGSQPVALVQDGRCGWTSTTRGLRLTTGPFGLRLRDRLGRVHQLERVATGSHAGKDVAGCYASSELGDVRIRSEDGVVVLCIGRAKPARLRHAGRVASDDVYVGDPGSPRLRRHSADGSVTIASGETVFARLPRVEPTPPEDALR